jgi:hypothetical protein
VDHYGLDQQQVMTRCIPESPLFVNDAERVVWERLRDGLGPDDVLLANLRLTDETKDHEADLIVLMPDLGIVVLEIKGGAIRYDEGWWQRRSRQDYRIDPVKQARESKYAAREYVASDPRWGSRTYIAWSHGVVTPQQDWPDDFSLPDLPRWTLHGCSDLDDLAERIRENARRLRQGKKAPTADDVELIADILAGRRTTSYDVEAEAQERADRAERLTQEQMLILQVTRLLHRVEVRGGAGSGKTVLALAQARELVRGRHDRPAQRVAVLCYSLGLAAYLKREVATWPRKHRPAFVGTFHALGREWGAPEGDRENSHFWEDELPELMNDLADGLSDKQRFDSIIVDEAQDFADSWWRPLLKALRDEEKSGLYIYSDENQRIFARFGQPPVPLVPLVLDHNLRNTRQIHEAFGPLAPSRMYSRGGDGPAVRFIASSAEDAVEAADEVIDGLLDDGWRPEHIALLTTGHRHPVQLERTSFHSQEEYWATWWDDSDVFYGHVLGCKGLERRVVVLCVNESVVRDRSRERLYVGMSRATDLLVVVGDPATIREMGGDAVASRLGI